MTLLAFRLFCPFVVFLFSFFPLILTFLFCFLLLFWFFPPTSFLQTFRLLLFLFLKHGEGIMLCGDPMSPTMSPTSFFFSFFFLVSPPLSSGSLLLLTRFSFFFSFLPCPSLFLSLFFLSFFFFFLLFAILLTPLLKTRFLAPQKKLQLPPCFNVLSIKAWECGSHHVFIFIFLILYF